ncbi:MAG: GntR family transcriptional regulator [Brevinema sp.]
MIKFPIIDKNSYIPAYIQIKDHFLKMIQSKELKPGDQIPPENDIVQASGLSRMTVRQGIQQLVQQGYLRPQRGLGTFVTPPPIIVDTMKFCSFSKTSAFKDQDVASRIYALQERKADAKIAKILNINIKDPIWYIERLRVVNQRPHMYEISYIPKHIFSYELTATDLEGSKYEWIQRVTAHTISFTKKEYFSTTAGQKISDIFNDVTPKTPIIQMCMTSLLENHTAFEYALVYFHPKNFQLSTIQSFNE